MEDDADDDEENDDDIEDERDMEDTNEEGTTASGTATVVAASVTAAAIKTKSSNISANVQDISPQNCNTLPINFLMKLPLQLSKFFSYCNTFIKSIYS